MKVRNYESIICSGQENGTSPSEAQYRFFCHGSHLMLTLISCGLCFQEETAPWEEGEVMSSKGLEKVRNGCVRSAALPFGNHFPLRSFPDVRIERAVRLQLA